MKNYLVVCIRKASLLASIKFIYVYSLFQFCTLGVSAQVFNDYYDFLEDYYYNFVPVYPDTFERGDQTLIERDATIWVPRVYPTRGFYDAYKANLDYTNSFNNYGRFGGGSCPFPTAVPGTWEQLGPVANGTTTGIAGQIHRIYFHPGYDAITNNKMYAASGFGGLWKSDDAAASWNLMKTDNAFPYCGVADAAICEVSGVDWIYVATGYPDGRLAEDLSPNVANVNPLFTQGVYRTNDDGSLWEPVDGGLMTNYFTNGGVIRRIIVEPGNPDKIMIASSSGIIYSSNATSITPTWNVGTLLGNPLIDPAFRGLEFNTSDPDIVYASGTDIFRSDDGGITWNSTTGSGTGLDWASLLSGFSFTPLRINIATDPSNSNFIYAYVMGSGRMFLFRYDENTAIWTQILTDPNNDYSQSYMAIAVDPQNPNIVYWGNTLVKKANVSLVNPSAIDLYTYQYNNTGGIYVDIHALVFDPINHELFVGHHGGISKHILATNSWTFANVGISNNIIWSFDDNETDKDEIIAAFQDQGIKTKQEFSGISRWHYTGFGGDGYSSRIYDDINKLAYISNGTWNSSVLQYDLERYDFNTLGYSLIPVSQFPPDQTPPLGQPIHFSKTFPTELHPITHEPYSGFSEIYRQVTANTWELESDIGKTEPETWKRQITELAISKSNPDIIYAITMGLDPCCPGFQWLLNPRLMKSATGFQNGNYGIDKFTEVDLLAGGIPTYSGYTQLPAISGIAIHPTNPNKIWITFVGYSELHKVYRSDDGGVSWINEDPNGCLLNLPVNGIVYQDGTDDRLYIATDRGVYTKDNTSDWQEYGDLPNVRVVELKINYCNNSIKVATFGRGIFEADLIPVSNGLTASLIIDQPTTWAADRFETGNIRVINGATLTVQGKLMMPYMGKIEVENGSTLYLNGGTITNNCDKMWDGIYLEDAGSVFTMDNSGTIENSVNGINSFNGAPITTSGNSIFNRNLYSIKLHPYTGTNPLNVSATTFTCVDGSTLPSLLNYPFNTQRSSVGIYVDRNTDVLIGDNSSITNKNFFFNLDYGISARISNMTIVNAGFEMIDDAVNPEDPNLLSGIAIFSVASKPTPATLDVGGYTPNGGFNTSEVTFKNCKRSVLAYDHVSTNIQYTRSENITLNSIDLQFSYSMSHFIDYNEFIGANVGINVFECENSGVLTISNNTYYLDPNSGTPTYLRRGIYLDNVISGNSNLSITGNRIEGSRIGIRVRNISDASITLNEVTPQTTGGTVNKFGIYLTRCARTRVVQNNVFRTASIPIQRIKAMTGIRIDRC